MDFLPSLIIFLQQQSFKKERSWSILQLQVQLPMLERTWKLFNVNACTRRGMSLLRNANSSKSRWIDETVYEYRGKAYAIGDEEFLWPFVIDRLVLKRSSLTKKYRVRNPATKKMLDLSGPWDTVNEMWMLYPQTTNKYKLACVCVGKGTKHGGCDVLTLGRRDLNWRTLDIPNLYDLGSKGVRSYVVATGDLWCSICHFWSSLPWHGRWEFCQYQDSTGSFLELEEC